MREKETADEENVMIDDTNSEITTETTESGYPGQLGKKTVTVNKTPSVQEVEAFWSNIWECEKEHNHGSMWLKRHEAVNEGIQSQTWRVIST